MNRNRRAAVSAAVATVVILAASGCGTSGASTDAGNQTLVLYNAQHENLMTAVTDAFTAKTGIKVEMRNGDDSELSNQLMQEGSASPADVFVTENSPGMTLVDSKGLFADLDQRTRAQTPAQYTATDGKWVGFAARSTALPYNTSKLTADQVPSSLMDLAKPEWKGRFGISPSGADFQAIVSAVVQLKGADAALSWLTGLKQNAKVYQGNSTVMKAVNSGEIETGVIYHYYWYEDQAEGGANSKNVKLKFLGNQDPGAFVSTSGAGVLASSKRQAQAQQFVAFLTSVAGQQAIVGSGTMEYPIASDVAANPALTPLSQLGAPPVDPTALNGPRVVELVRQAGLS